MIIPIIYEDKDILVVNKPAGLMVHPDGRSKDSTLSDWIVENYPETINVGEPLITSDETSIPRPGIVHRLDMQTSGVLVVAKTQEAFEFLKKQFQNHEVEKTYHAFVYGSVKNDSGSIEKPIGKSKSDFRKFSAEYGARGKLRESVTEYKVIERGKITDTQVSYLEINPKTGRTHQVRVHLKSIGHPIVCDKLYAENRECILGFTRHALHASTLTLTILSGTRLKLEAPLPEDFMHGLREIEEKI